MEENKSLYYKFGTKIITEPDYVKSKLTTDWKKLFLEPIKWLFKNPNHNFEDTLYELHDISIENNDGNFKIYKDHLGLVKTILDRNLMENPIWIHENFIIRFFNSDEEFSKFYSFLKSMVLMPDDKLENGCIVFKLE